MDAVFPIYSITKTLTPICALRLVENGSLGLTDVVREWLPDVNIPATITLTHLLRHRSGLRDYGWLPECHASVRTRPDQPWTRKQFSAACCPNRLCLRPARVSRTPTSATWLVIETLERASGIRSHDAIGSRGEKVARVLIGKPQLARKSWILRP